jgi:hypothetical protein
MWRLRRRVQRGDVSADGTYGRWTHRLHAHCEWAAGSTVQSRRGDTLKAAVTIGNRCMGVTERHLQALDLIAVAGAVLTGTLQHARRRTTTTNQTWSACVHQRTKECTSAIAHNWGGGFIEVLTHLVHFRDSVRVTARYCAPVCAR